MAQISFSIVVVCRNPGKKLMSTVRSVLEQQYGNYEIVVKDGGSTDGSLEELPADSRIRLLAGRDGGIYDAMNRALSQVNGQYVLFLNCGDALHDREVLSRMAEIIEERLRADGESRCVRERIFYGDQYHLGQKCVVCSAPEINDFVCYRNVPCHQLCFYDARLFSQRGYLTKYRVRADYEHFLYCIYERNAEAVYTGILVADYVFEAPEHREIAQHYLGREKVLRYRTILLLTLAPLRTRIAESEKLSGGYNAVKSALYRLRQRGGKGR